MITPEILNALAAKDAHLRSQLAAYLASESTLDNVARLPLPAPFTIVEDAEMQFDNDGRVDGKLTLSWPERRLTAVLDRRIIGVTEITNSSGDTARIEPVQKSKWIVDRAHVDDVSLHLSEHRGTFDVDISEILNARKLTITTSTGTPAYHRTTFRAGNLDGYPHLGYDGDSKELAYNQMRTTVFGLEARIRSVSRGRTADANLITLTYQGSELDATKARSLWILLSFFVGPRLEIVCYERFDSNGNRLDLRIPNGVEHSGTGHPPLQTREPAGEGLARQFPDILENVHTEMASGFPWHVAFHHLEESHSNYPESAVKNLAIALDSIIEAHIGEIGKDRFIPKNAYKALITPMIAEIRRFTAADGHPIEFAEHMEEVLARENHRGTSEKRKMFFKEFTIDTAPYADGLAMRDPALHTGHVLDYLTTIDYLVFAKDVGALRTLVNRSFLKRLGYTGSMHDFQNDAVVPV